MNVDEDGYFYISAKILPPPPPLSKDFFISFYLKLVILNCNNEIIKLRKALFTEVKGKWLVNNADIINTYFNVNLFQCAAYCVEERQCLSFDFTNDPALR